MVSKIAKRPIVVPQLVTVEIKDGMVEVAGPKGTMVVELPRGVEIVREEQGLAVRGEGEAASALCGLTRTLVANAISGVVEGWSKSLELVGTGYRASLEGESLVLSVGFSHPVIIKPPAGIKFVIDQNKITVGGVDKQLVGDLAASIRRVRPPEPYKGKGIRYSGEVVRRKVGKAAKAVGTAGGK